MRCLSLDLEIHKDDGRIFALAAVDERTGEALTWRGSRRGSRGWERKLGEIDEVGSDCDALVGHNLIAHDLPHLRAAAPGLRLLRLPVIDTLRLSPLAFPAHPYHHLVKHYKDGGLVQGQRNDPELDARLALKLLDDEREALNRAGTACRRTTPTCCVSACSPRSGSFSGWRRWPDQAAGTGAGAPSSPGTGGRWNR